MFLRLLGKEPPFKVGHFISGTMLGNLHAFLCLLLQLPSEIYVVNLIRHKRKKTEMVSNVPKVVQPMRGRTKVREPLFIFFLYHIYVKICWFCSRGSPPLSAAKMAVTYVTTVPLCALEDPSPADRWHGSPEDG